MHKYDPEAPDLAPEDFDMLGIQKDADRRTRQLDDDSELAPSCITYQDAIQAMLTAASILTEAATDEEREELYRPQVDSALCLIHAANFLMDRRKP